MNIKKFLAILFLLISQICFSQYQLNQFPNDWLHAPEQGKITLPASNLYMRFIADSSTSDLAKSYAPHELFNNGEINFWLDTLKFVQPDMNLQPEILPNYFNGHNAFHFQYRNEDKIYPNYKFNIDTILVSGLVVGNSCGNGYIALFVIKSVSSNDTTDIFFGDVADYGFMMPVGWTGSKGFIGQDDGGHRQVGGGDSFDTLKHIVAYTPTQLYLDGRKISTTYFSGYSRGWHFLYFGHGGFPTCNGIGIRNGYIADAVIYSDTTKADSIITCATNYLNSLYHWKCTSTHTQISDIDIEQWDTTNIRVKTTYMTVPSFKVNWYRNNISNGINTYELTQADSSRPALWKGLFNQNHTYLRRGDTIHVNIISKDQYYPSGDTVANYTFCINPYSILIPQLISDSSSAPICITSSSQVNGANEKWRAFDANTLRSWWACKLQSTGWIQVDFGAGNEKTVREYTLYASPRGNENNAFKTWSLLGSNTGKFFDTLDCQVNVSEWYENEKRDFMVTNINPYRYYRISVTADWGGRYCGMSEIQFKGISFDKLDITKTENPKSFSLYQNYPNPFNPTTKIKFDVPNVKGEMSKVKIIIYDILGREIATVMNEQLKPGTYQYEWDGNHFASGIYFYKLTSAEFTETKKMVLVK